MESSDEVFNVSNGSKDFGNRYASVVLVAIGGVPECSGVIIHPRLVLTAGHCVCRGREDQNTITLDSSACEKTATAIAVAYDASTGRPNFRRYTGTVRPHRGFRAVLKKKRLSVPAAVGSQGNQSDAGTPYVVVNTVSESKADLALILLDSAAEGLFPPVPLARTHPTAHAPVVVVGYGADAVENGLAAFNDEQPTRRFGKNFIAQPGDERFMIEPPGSLALPGDSGGPCFREQPEGLSLVGINSRSAPGKRATFTSTYHYLDWLDAEIRRTNQM
ncbi:trypsin-like serine peptidase [Hyalangium gracile]|uniref:trypsin-like serine peptidase n=1 Tax=Hyalangium gracile TaxID=394092 RepID=UPI001CCB22D1|nr:trypsin-like serine protease [Hyalangium gracile]